ncbi:hypothetical protein [Streptomyces sp. NPDC046862]|uniref:hypothetical protein n=1 Tax=Streptomyces sp. NPDC046862 TaxID=3154603 RepID=UPI003455387B
MNRRTALLTALGFLGWWALLAALWLVFISTVDPLELLVGGAVAGVGTASAWGARRAVSGR